MSADRMVSIPLDMIRLLPDRAVGEFLSLAFTAKSCQGQESATHERIGAWSRLLTATQFAELLEALDTGRQGAPASKPSRAVRPERVHVDKPPRSAGARREAVLRALSSGPQKAEDIRRTCDLTEGEAKGLLKRLAEEGAITITGAKRSTRYALTSTPTPTVTEDS